MAARALVTTVHVRDEDGVDHAFGPGDTVPGWAKSQITNPKAWDDGEDDSPLPPPDGVPEPPRSGAGSGVKAWADYAAAISVEVPEGATAADIQAAVDAARTNA